MAGPADWGGGRPRPGGRPPALAAPSGPAATARLGAGEAQAVAELERGVAQFRGSVDAAAGFIPRRGERRRRGEAIATASRSPPSTRWSANGR